MPEPCIYCGDTDGDCRCSLPGVKQALRKIRESGAAVDPGLVYAEYFDDLCDELKAKMVNLLEILGYADFMIAMQKISKEVLKDA